VRREMGEQLAAIRNVDEAWQHDLLDAVAQAARLERDHEWEAVVARVRASAEARLAEAVLAERAQWEGKVVGVLTDALQAAQDQEASEQRLADSSAAAVRALQSRVRGLEAAVAAGDQARAQQTLDHAREVASWEESTAQLIADAVVEEATAWQVRQAAVTESAVLAERAGAAMEAAAVENRCAMEMRALADRHAQELEQQRAAHEDHLAAAVREAREEAEQAGARALVSAVEEAVEQEREACRARTMEAVGALRREAEVGVRIRGDGKRGGGGGEAGLSKGCRQEGS
jgi:hypothetical protein